MRILHNALWGVLTTLWVASLLAIVALGFWLLSTEARAEIAEMGGLARLLLAYVVAAIAAGLALGLSRPVARFVVGKHVVGAITTSVAVASFLALMTGFKLFSSVHSLVIVLAAGLLAGAALTPIYYHSSHLWLPDFDSWLRGIDHTATITGRANEPDDNAA